MQKKISYQCLSITLTPCLEMSLQDSLCLTYSHSWVFWEPVWGSHDRHIHGCPFGYFSLLEAGFGSSNVRQGVSSSHRDNAVPSFSFLKEHLRSKNISIWGIISKSIFRLQILDLVKKGWRLYLTRWHIYIAVGRERPFKTLSLVESG